MTTTVYFHGDISQEALRLSERELFLRLQSAKGAPLALPEGCEGKLRQAISCRYVGMRTSLSFPAENQVDFGAFCLKSRDLYRNVYGCREALVFAVTLGHEVDRLLRRVSLCSVSEHFIYDAYASALAEAAADAAEERLLQQEKARPRFSPGYGDLTLEAQRPILEALSAGQRLSLALSESLMLSPMKSVTAICALAPQQTKKGNNR